jgi:hypothetical protein
MKPCVALKRPVIDQLFIFSGLDIFLRKVTRGLMFVSKIARPTSQIFVIKSWSNLFYTVVKM